jgi:hypothetical protein
VIPYTEDDGTQLVRRPHIYAVELAMPGDGIQVDDTGCVYHGKARSAELACEAPESAQSAGFIGSGEKCETKIGVTGLGRPLKRKPISRGPDDKIRGT